MGESGSGDGARNIVDGFSVMTTIVEVVFMFFFQFL